jgi:hypothetical protein
MLSRCADDLLFLPAQGMSGKIGIFKVIYTSALSGFLTSVKLMPVKKFAIYGIDNTSPHDSVPQFYLQGNLELVDEIDLTDEQNFASSDDTSFTMRPWKCGKSLFCKLWHKVNGLADSASPFLTHDVMRNQTFYHHKKATAIGAWLVLTLYCAYYPAVWMLERIKKEDSFAHLSFCKDGIQFASQIRS